MKTPKAMIALLAFAALFIQSFAPAALAANVYSPDNSLRADPLQSTKQLGGNLEVGEFTGVAIYHYPVSLPAGRNGMTPGVQLTYNSQDSALDNIVGFHWSLNQYSIKRINKKGVENMYARTDFVANGPFGGGELVLLRLDDGQHGQYGEKNERSFAKYEYRADNRWVVTDKRGIQYIFGSQDENRQSDPDDATRTFQWMLEEIRDRNDNGATFAYLKDGNQLYPKTIHYTNHGTEEGIYEVRFLPFADGSVGATRADSHTSFAEGFKVETQRLVTGIEVRVEGQLRRKFEIGHATVYPLIKNTVGSILETGYTLDGNATSLPATTFEYTPSAVRWEETTDYQFPGFFEKCYIECDGPKGLLEWDMNGDGLTDFEYYADTLTPRRATNNGKNGWTEGSSQFLPGNQVYAPTIPNIWDKAYDFDGDVRTDLVSSGWAYNDARDGSVLKTRISLNNGQQYIDTIQVGFGTVSAGQNDNGASIADLNGDGLPDVIQARQGYQSRELQKNTCLNTGTISCNLTGLWQAPQTIISDTQWSQTRLAYVQDCNSDGLADFQYFGINSIGQNTWVNDGKGGWTTPNAQCQFTLMDSLIYRSLDANGDGLMDQVVSGYLTGGFWPQLVNNLQLNTGNGFQTLQNLFPISLGTSNDQSSSDAGVRIVDLNGDGLPDILQSIKTTSPYGNGESVVTKKAYFNRGSRPYFLKTVRTSGGATIDMETMNSAQLRTANDTQASSLASDTRQANPNLPLNLPVLTKMTVNDGLGNGTFTEYQYEDGHYFFQDSDHREFAGFRMVTKTDSLGFKTKTYFHQDENSVADVANGEWADHLSKKGMPYRTEAYDNQGRLVRVAINKIEKTTTWFGTIFAYVQQTVTADIDPATGAKRATAKALEYDDFGNPTVVTDFGEVILNGNDGSFADIGNDLLKQTTHFAQNLTDYLVGLAFESKLADQSGKQVSHQRIYYEGLALGEVTKGNPTKTETWLSTTDGFLAGTTDYDDFGLPIRQTNPRGFSTTMEYDAFRLYPTSVTNALGQTVRTVLDPGIGQPLETTDANGLKTKSTYDGLGRSVKMEISDPKNPDNMIVTKTFEFHDRTMPRISKQVAHNDDGEAVESFAYADGLGRTIETKQEASNGKWVTMETVFDERGNVEKSIQPFFASASDFEAVDANKTGTSFAYDALGRATVVTNPLGTTTTAYDGWNQTVTDPNGKIHDYQFDARGRLTQVTEHLGAQANQTNYAYDALGNLIGLTDALGNARAFTYDSLSHRLTQTDAAKAGRSGHVWSYKYDENGNLTERLDANGKAVHTTYDELDRATQMDLDSQPGIDFSFQYDQGANAIGRLSAVIGQNYEKRPTYDLLGRVTLEQKMIAGKSFDFANDYDLMGGVKTLTYPDGMTVDYATDSAHQLSKVSSDGKTFADQFDFSPLGQLAQVHLGNDIVTTNIYDPEKLYRLTEKKSLLFDTVRVQDFLYNYDPVGNLMKLDDQSNAITSKTVDYRYDDLYRLMEARYTNTGNQQLTVSNFQYDPIGNLIFKSDLGAYEYKADNPHAVTKAGEKTFEYDSAGNMIQRDGKNYSYDEFGKITKIGDETVYQYDEAGQRILKTDLKTGESMIYVNDLFESDANEDVKYVFAGKQKISKVVRKHTPPPADSGDIGGGTMGGGTVGGGTTGGSSGGTSGNTIGSVGGGSNPTLSPTASTSTTESGGGMGLDRVINTQPKADEKVEKKVEASFAEVKGTSLFLNQDGDRKNTPKFLWPETGAKSAINFKHLSIVYLNTKAVLRWDGMGSEAVKFEIYRSSKPYPGTESKNTAVKLATVRASTNENRFEDREIKKGERYSYRVVALNRKNQRILTSLILSPETLFVAEGSGSDVRFGEIDAPAFTQVRLEPHPYLVFEKTQDLKTIRIRPAQGFRANTRITVQFMKCQTKRSGRLACQIVAEKTLSLVVVHETGLMARLRKLADRLAGLVAPKARASGVGDDEKLYYFLSDHLGGTDSVLDDQGNVVERRDYLPFGEERIAEVIGTDKERHGFTGKELDSESGLYYYGARYYDSALGRFASLDPLLLGESSKSLQSVLANPQALNGYSYVLNNPVRYVDETGMYEEDIHYDLTYFLGLAAGLSNDQSKTVAYNDQNTDDNPATLPSNFESLEGMVQTLQNVSTGVTSYYHFISRKEAMTRLGEAMIKGSLEDFGTAMHGFQDTYSHAGLKPLTHAALGHSPDKTPLNVTKAYSMAKSSFFFLRGMDVMKNGLRDKTNDEYNKETDTIWSQMKGGVLDYLKKEDKSQTDIAKNAAVAKNGDEIKSK